MSCVIALLSTTLNGDWPSTNQVRTCAWCACNYKRAVSSVRGLWRWLERLVRYEHSIVALRTIFTTSPSTLYLDRALNNVISTTTRNSGSAWLCVKNIDCGGATILKLHTSFSFLTSKKTRVPFPPIAHFGDSDRMQLTLLGTIIVLAHTSGGLLLLVRSWLR